MPTRILREGILTDELVELDAGLAAGEDALNAHPCSVAATVQVT